MFDNLMTQMKTQAEEVKKKLDEMYITEEVENGLVKVTVNGNQKVKNIEIGNEIATDKEAIEDLVLTAVNRAMEKAEKVKEKEMGSIAQGMLPNLGGLFGK